MTGENFRQLGGESFNEPGEILIIQNHNKGGGYGVKAGCFLGTMNSTRRY